MVAEIAGGPGDERHLAREPAGGRFVGILGGGHGVQFDTVGHGSVSSESGRGGGPGLE